MQCARMRSPARAWMRNRHSWKEKKTNQKDNYYIHSPRMVWQTASRERGPHTTLRQWVSFRAGKQKTKTPMTSMKDHEVSWNSASPLWPAVVCCKENHDHFINSVNVIKISVLIIASVQVRRMSQAAFTPSTHKHVACWWKSLSERRGDGN